MATNGVISWLPISLTNANAVHILASAKTTFRPETSARSIGYLWRSCKRLENTQIRVPLRNELLEQTRLALILFVSSHAHDVPGFYLQYKIALSTDSH